MSTFSDQLVGLLLLSVSIAVFAYYTVWALVLPFVDESFGIHRYFLARHWAFALPSALLITGLGGISAFIAVVMIKTHAKKAKKAKSN